MRNNNYGFEFDGDSIVQKWGVKYGQLWHIGNHSILVGDATRPDDVGLLLGGGKINLINADPPYGIGKFELAISGEYVPPSSYLDFMLSWWDASIPFMADCASVYVWGNARNLWAMWYSERFAESGKLVFRNEIIWDKKHARGMKYGDAKKYVTGSERCLFFSFGKCHLGRSFDDFHECWSEIVDYLRQERKKAGWTNRDMENIVGVTTVSHWFAKSQFHFILEKYYNMLHEASDGKAFQKPYSILRKQYNDANREVFYFDNTHEPMTDVWRHKKVAGERRFGHQTPKPIDMMARIIKTSCPPSGTVYVPFGGTCPEMFAAEETGRTCKAIEKEPLYCALTLERMERMFGVTGKLAVGAP